MAALWAGELHICGRERFLALCQGVAVQVEGLGVACGEDLGPGVRNWHNPS